MLYKDFVNIRIFPKKNKHAILQQDLAKHLERTLTCVLIRNTAFHYCLKLLVFIYVILKTLILRKELT